MDSEYSSLLEKLDRVTAYVTRLEARVETLELRLNHVFDTEARCRSIIGTALNYLFQECAKEVTEEVIKNVVYLIRRHDRDIIISEGELAKLIISEYFDVERDRERTERREQKKQAKLIEEISSLSLGEEEEISSPVTIVGEEELASPITEEDVAGIEAVTSLSS